MKYIFMFADIKFSIHTDVEVEITNEMENFVSINDNNIDCYIEICQKNEVNYHSRNYMIGEDLIQEYYQEDGKMFCELKGGDKGPIGCVSYDKSFKYFICTLNQYKFQSNLYMMSIIVRTLPIRAIFLHFHTLFFHASQISVNGIGILFTAASGVGKSTQAKLWHEFENAHIVCNDRTLVRKKNDQWCTYGYPLDGSEPVMSNEKNKLGAIVLLKQGKENRIEKFSIVKMVSLLIEQIVLDTWNYEMRDKALALLFELVNEIPVYVLTCTPDQRAVNVLKNQLQKEGVIK